MRADTRIAGAWLWLALAMAGVVHADRAQAGERDVVFLLGDDAPGRKPYFDVAASYFERSEPDTRRVGTLRSLAEVREYLVRHRGNRPWRRVTLVAHGAPWVGLHVPVFVDGPEASLEALAEARDSGEFPPMPAGVFDADTQLRLDSCGLGRRPDFLAALGRLLSPADGPVVPVQSSAQFVAYRVDGTQARRFELPFVATVLKRPPGGVAATTRAEAVRGLERELQQSGSGAWVPAEAEALPVTIGLALEGPLPDGAEALQAHLAGEPGLARRLRSHGLVLSDLDWRVVAAGPGSRVEGRALLLLVRAQARAP